MANLTTMLAKMINPEVMGQMLQAQLPQAVRFTSIAPIDTTLQVHRLYHIMLMVRGCISRSGMLRKVR